jgi:glycine cleavage system H lipoate-binding protein
MIENWKNEGQEQQAEIRLLKCIWMMSGTVTFKLCDRDYDCEHCAFYQAWLETKEDRCKAGETETHRHRAGHDGTAFQLPPGNNENIGDVFLHPGHLWARVEEQGKVRIGLDDFAQRLVGRIYNVRFPAAETRISNGSACWWIVHAAGETKVPIPIRGTLEKGNEKLMVSPSLINQDPYGEGWALYVRPDNLESSLKEFHYGEQARAWSEQEYSRLNQEIAKLTEHSSVDLGTTLPDGGRPFENFISFLSPEQQRKMIALFLKGGL